MSRNFGLDVIRVVSIWMMLVYHLGFKSRLLLPHGVGGYGVEFFFVLSGFLVGGLMFKSLFNELSFRSVVQFWTRRCFLMLTLYYFAVLTKFYFIGPDIGSNILYYLFFLQNHFYGIQFYGVTWSLVIEEWFYILAPMLVGITMWRTNSSIKAVFSIVLAVILLSIVARFFYAWDIGMVFSAINGNVPLRFDSLFWGVALALVKSKYADYLVQLSLIIGLTYLSAFVMYVMFERPMLILRDRLTNVKVSGKKYSL
ncbi:MAG: acyltransferase [Flavobacteriales bacterium]